MRVLLASIVCEKGELEANLANHIDLLHTAQHGRCDLAVFPEFSLTGSVDPITHPERAVALEDDVVQRMVAATQATRVPALFGIGERSGGEFFISQIYACGGRILGVQRKRHLGEDEEGHSVGHESTVFELGSIRFAAVICAESGVSFTWDAAASAGAQAVFFTSAPGLYGRRTDEASWRAGFEWWETRGLADARTHARRCGLWVGMATQAGSVCDEDFPGIAALVAPTGEIVDRLPDWTPGVLMIDIPIDI